jgi:hypothetical protein
MLQFFAINSLSLSHSHYSIFLLILRICVKTEVGPNFSITLSVVLTYSYINFYLNLLFARLCVLAAEKDFVFFKLLAVDI